MKSKLHPVSVGSFVIGGIILLVIGILSFQSLNFFNKPLHFVSYFDEPVQGLNVGSNVRLRGVIVGRVLSINIQYDWKENKSRVVVLSEFNKNTMTDPSGNKINVADLEILQKLIEEGLRAKIDLAGITGLQFIELDFLDPNKNKAVYPDTKVSDPVIPSVESGMSKLTDNVVQIADHVRDVDFGKMTSQITGAAGSIERLASFLEKNPSSLIFGRKSEPKPTKKR